MAENRLEVGRIRMERTVPYYVVRGGVSAGRGRLKGAPAWLVLHGYGERAADFIGRCRGLLSSGNGVIVAPEGPSRFYHRSGRGTIGASWMTSDLREEEMIEYCGMIDQVLHRALPDRSGPLSILGFSQGGATAMRYALRSGREVDRLVMWGAGFQESELEEYRDRLSQIDRVLFVQGKEDRIVRAATLESTALAIERLGAKALRLHHPGGHELDEKLIAQIGVL